MSRGTKSLLTVRTGTLKAEFFGDGRQALNPPDPAFPDGKDVDGAQGRPGCGITLDHPTPEYGSWLITCSTCGFKGVITAAGRPDDPRAVRVPCKIKEKS